MNCAVCQVNSLLPPSMCHVVSDPVCTVCQVNSLLPPSMFLSVVSGLLSSELAVVRRRAMELLATRLQLQPDYFTEADSDALLQLTQGMGGRDDLIYMGFYL